MAPAPQGQDLLLVRQPLTAWRNISWYARAEKPLWLLPWLPRGSACFPGSTVLPGRMALTQWRAAATPMVFPTPKIHQPTGGELCQL
jgi:hypothetical protein